MRHIPAYAQYVSSQTAWIGAIPEGWRTLRGKFVFKECSERSTLGTETLLSVSEYYGVKPREDTLDQGEFISRADSLVGYKKCQANDLAMNIMLAWKKGLGVSKYEGIVSPSYSVFRFLPGSHPGYMHYLLRTDLYADHFKSRSTGIMDSRLRLYPEAFADIKILLPSLEEQTKIAWFLDYETARIDALIEKQQQLIALLKEKRQAVISHAVTKGLNPNAPLRDSGVEWLGMVPAHWEVAPVKHVFGNLNFRRVPLSTTERGTRQGEYDYYGASGVIDHIDGYIFDEPTILVGEDGANLLNRSTPLAFPAFGKYWVNNHAHILRPPDEMIRFWVEAIEHIDITPLVSGSAQPKLTAEALMNLKIAFPPSRGERSEIDEFVATRDRKLADLQARAVQQVELLQERRTALISAAVTGKIDVRGWKPPDASAEQEVA